MSTHTRRPLVVANWKMNGSIESNAQWVKAFCAKSSQDFRGVDIAVCPPHIYIAQMFSLLSETPVALGCQDIHQEDNGAFTGETSATMVKDYKCRYAIIGHSERRQIFHEDNARIAHKIRTVIAAGLTPILCIGETAEQRQRKETEQILKQQVTAGLEFASKNDPLVLAYEPVWAIGSGLSASEEQAEEGCYYIRSVLTAALGDSANNIRILYGGSINKHNVAPLFSLPNVDGGLIGGASLDGETFWSMCGAATDIGFTQ